MATLPTGWIQWVWRIPMSCRPNPATARDDVHARTYTTDGSVGGYPGCRYGLGAGRQWSGTPGRVVGNAGAVVGIESSRAAGARAGAEQVGATAARCTATAPARRATLVDTDSGTEGQAARALSQME